MDYFYLSYGGLNGLTLADFEGLSVGRRQKLIGLMQEQKGKERKEAEAAKAKGRRK
jgi:hypothetical protein